MKSDILLEKEILERIQWALGFKKTGIGIKVNEGALVLSGSVDSLTDKITVENAAMTVTGIKSVSNRLQVDIPARDRINDAEIKNRLLEAIVSRELPESEKVTVGVEDGVVTLQGVLSWEYLRSEIRGIAEKIRGVKDVISLIEVVSTFADAAEVKKKIGQTFLDTFGFAASAANIQIKVEEGRVTISGEVNNLAEKKTAEKAAWLVPGVTSVINEITVPVLIK